MNCDLCPEGEANVALLGVGWRPYVLRCVPFGDPAGAPKRGQPAPDHGDHQGASRKATEEAAMTDDPSSRKHHAQCLTSSEANRLPP